MEAVAWALLGAAALWLLAVGLRLVPRWRLRAVPLVRPLPFLLGHIWCFRTTPMYLCYERWMRQLGPIFLVFFGKNPVVVLSDPDLIRQVAVKQFVKFHDRPSFVAMPVGKNKRLVAIRSGLLVSRGGTWGSLRAAMNPLFHTQALQAYNPVINSCVGRFLERLEAATAEPGTPLEVHALLGRMTLEAIGRSAFGVEFITEGDEADRRAGRPNLVAAVKVIFSNAGFTPGAGLGVLFRVLPDFAEPFLFWLAFTAMGTMARQLEYARSTFMSTADLLMQAAKRQALARGEKLQMQETDWRWWGPQFVEQNPYKDVTPAPGSVIDMLMRATNKETGQGLRDVQIAAQCNTLIAAGYETTANALAYCIYCLATHPEAEAKLLAEVDAFGTDREPTLDDAPAFPYTEAVINESLRLYPPAHTSNRECTQDGAVLTGRDGTRYPIPKGVWVHFNIWGMHHSEEHWRAPLAFRPERFLDAEEVAARHPNAFLPFGLGPRNCIGFKFALQEIRIALVRIYQRYMFRLAEGHEGPLKLRMGITLTPADGVWVTAHPRHTSSTAAAT